MSSLRCTLLDISRPFTSVPAVLHFLPWPTVEIPQAFRLPLLTKMECGTVTETRFREPRQNKKSLNGHEVPGADAQRSAGSDARRSERATETSADTTATANHNNNNDNHHHNGDIEMYSPRWRASRQKGFEQKLA